MRELDIIEKIRTKLPKGVSGLVRGVGDDCAVTLPTKANMLVSTDTLVEGKHFDLSWHHPFELGAKAMAVNISDIAAMGGIANYVTISLSYTSDVSPWWLDNFLDGIMFMSKLYDVSLIGGDTVSSKEMNISLTILGEAVSPVYRDGAQVGDSIFVGGALGSAGGGLYLFQNHFEGQEPVIDNARLRSFTSEYARYGQLLQHHLSPRPQLKLGQALGESGMVHAMQDLSDGIATDLSHIAKASGVRAVLQEELIPVLPELQHLCTEYDLCANEMALKSGDDYLLVFTCSPQDEKKIEMIAASVKSTIYKVGTIESGDPSVMLKTGDTVKDISYQGYQHKAQS